jgi:hypothetical protein
MWHLWRSLQTRTGGSARHTGRRYRRPSGRTSTLACASVTDTVIAKQIVPPPLLGTLIRKHVLETIVPFDGGCRHETNGRKMGPIPWFKNFPGRSKVEKKSHFSRFSASSSETSGGYVEPRCQTVRLAIPRDPAKRHLDVRCGKNVVTAWKSDFRNSAKTPENEESPFSRPPEVRSTRGWLPRMGNQNRYWPP